MSQAMVGLRVLTALTCFVSGVLFLLFWGVNVTFWTLVGILMVIVAFAAGVLIIRKDYLEGATPAGLSGVFTVFLLFPPAGYLLLAVVLLFLATGLAVFLYEVD